MKGKRWEHEVEQKVFDALNQIESTAGRPLPPVMRMAMTKILTSQATSLHDAARWRAIAFAGAFMGYLGTVAIAPPHNPWLVLARGVAIGVAATNSYFVGWRHHEVKTLEGMTLGLRVVAEEDE